MKCRYLVRNIKLCLLEARYYVMVSRLKWHDIVVTYDSHGLEYGPNKTFFYWKNYYFHSLQRELWRNSFKILNCNRHCWRHYKNLKSTNQSFYLLLSLTKSFSCIYFDKILKFCLKWCRITKKKIEFFFF